MAFGEFSGLARGLIVRSDVRLPWHPHPFADALWVGLIEVLDLRSNGMLEFAEDLARPVARAVLTTLRVIWWVTWELCIETVSWYIGWPVCRAISFGHFPEVRLQEQDEVGSFAGLVVHATGLVSLLGLIYLLARYVGG
ncbi:MAG: hypothetical protein M3Q42_01980 [Pseudomonadota bacterium]|nr:hypothetical protein [Pseudomonadota bacterium]